MTSAVAFRSADADLPQRVVNAVSRFYATATPEKAYLHFDKPVYVGGETIWFKAYVVDAATHRPDSLSRVLYVDLLGPDKQVLSRRTLRLNQGTAAGDLALPDAAAEGTYTVRAYTNWMRNAGPDYFFVQHLPVWQHQVPTAAGQPAQGKTKSRPAPAAPTRGARPDLQFFPEGGNLVAQLPGVVAFKAVGPDGRGMDVEGTVEDQQGRVVARFKSGHAGMGVLRLRPESGVQYVARLQTPAGVAATYPLPAVQPTGYGMMVTQTPDQVVVGVSRQGTTEAPESVLLVAHVRGEVAYVGQTTVGNGTNDFLTRIPKTKFPSGIVHVTLFDGAGTALCERLAFVNRQDGLQVHVKPDKSAYGPRSQVNLNIETRNAAGQPVPAQLSVAVVSAAVQAQARNTIQAQLLLAADLAGTIEDPAYYFRDNRPQTVQALDELLLTQGWRRFVWKPLLAGQLPAATYAPEVNPQVSGRVSRTNKKPASEAVLTLIKAGSSRDVAVLNADALGRFAFGVEASADTTRVAVQARAADGSKAVDIRLDERWAPLPAGLVPPLWAPPVASYVQRSQREQVVERQVNPDSTRRILLNNVTIKGKREQPKETNPFRRDLPYSPGLLRKYDVQHMDGVGAYGSILDLIQNRMPGWTVHRERGEVWVVNTRGLSPYFMLDGIPVDVKVVDGVQAVNVESMDITTSGTVPVYGMARRGGVVSIFSKTGSSGSTLAPVYANVVTARVPAYYQAREFYAPRYDAAALKAAPDYRTTTLYWTPQVQTDATGRAQVTFYTADQADEFRINAEGLGHNGQPGLGNATLLVQRDK
ncbi:hypothetical protein B0919_16135 [Hymenobacter sp. CRA2]|nr:hypothetical protein B0919_16135 [Hymenobacter sp. CRA2]